MPKRPDSLTLIFHTQTNGETRINGDLDQVCETLLADKSAQIISSQGGCPMNLRVYSILDHDRHAVFRVGKHDIDDAFSAQYRLPPGQQGFGMLPALLDKDCMQQSLRFIKKIKAKLESLGAWCTRTCS